MNKVLFPKKDYVKELGRIFKSSKNSQKLVKALSKYHEKDIAEAITLLTPAERQHIYNVNFFNFIEKTLIYFLYVRIIIHIMLYLQALSIFRCTYSDRSQNLQEVW